MALPHLRTSDVIHGGIEHRDDISSVLRRMSTITQLAFFQGYVPASKYHRVNMFSNLAEEYLSGLSDDPVEHVQMPSAVTYSSHLPGANEWIDVVSLSGEPTLLKSLEMVSAHLNNKLLDHDDPLVDQSAGEARLPSWATSPLSYWMGPIMYLCPMRSQTFFDSTLQSSLGTMCFHKDQCVRLSVAPAMHVATTRQASNNVQGAPSMTDPNTVEGGGDDNSESRGGQERWTSW